MSNKIKPCISANGRHAWSFLRNVRTSSTSGRVVHFAIKGRYRCTTCNTSKLGAFNPNEPDLKFL